LRRVCYRDEWRGEPRRSPLGRPSSAVACYGGWKGGLASAQFRFDTPQLAAGSFIKRTKDKDINVDVKKLKGSWTGYYRIKKGKIRIIFDYKNKAVFIEKIDFRGDVYKK